MVCIDIIFDILKKSLKLTRVLMQESFKFFPNNKNIGFIFQLMLILLRLKQAYLFKQNNCKQHSILAYSFSGCIIVFLFLIKVVTLQIVLNQINFEKPSFQQFFSKSLQNNKNKSQKRFVLQYNLKDRLKIIFDKSNYDDINNKKTMTHQYQQNIEHNPRQGNYFCYFFL